MSKLHRLTFNGKTTIVRAESKNALKAHVFKTIGYSADVPNAEDVASYLEDGNKIETIVEATDAVAEAAA